jgi:hypothetical protein
VVLTFKARRALPASDFALPGRRYPIHDQAHALQALRQMGHATPAERALIEQRVYARYPALRPMEKESSVLYRGKTFPGYNQPVDSDLPQKKKMVLVRSGGRVKLVHFGQKGYRHNYSEAAKKDYLARSGGIRNKEGELTKSDPFSPNYWARKVLWPSGEPEKKAGLDFLGLLAKKVGAGRAGDAMIQAHKGAGDAVEGGVRRALSWEVPGTKGIHLPGATPERRAKAVDWLAKTSRMAVEDPELGALILAPVPGTDVAAFGLKRAKDGLRRRLGLLPELPKTAEADEKFGGQLRLALTADDRAQLADLKSRADASGFSAVRTSQGVAIYTHRARTAYYPSFDKIPVARARFIDSTG